jgi:hypothetical protein
MRSHLKYRSGKTGLVLGILIFLSLLLAACGNDAPTPIPPTPTIAISFRNEKEPSFFLEFAVLSDWVRTIVNSTTVTYAPPTLANVSLTINYSSISRLNPNSTAVSDRRIEDIRKQYRDVRITGNRTLNISNREVNFTELKYNNGQDVTEFIGQINFARSEKAYLITGLLSDQNAERLRDPMIQTFTSMKFTPPEISANPLLTPTITASPTPDRGLLAPTPGSVPSQGQQFSFLDWTTPQLNGARSPSVTLSVRFPANWNWGYKNFPTNDAPGLFLTSNIPTAKGPIGLSAAEANIHIGLILNAFPSESSPVPADWEKAIKPNMDLLNDFVLPGLGSNVRVALPIQDAAGIKKTNFTVRAGEGGPINVRGFIYFRNIGRNLLMTVLYISPDAALNDLVVARYDADTTTLINSIRPTVK